jgi:hypothetical protein
VVQNDYSGIIANLYGAHRMTGLQAVRFSLTRKGSLYKYGALLASYEPPGDITINDLAKGVKA